MAEDSRKEVIRIKPPSVEGPSVSGPKNEQPEQVTNTPSNEPLRIKPPGIKGPKIPEKEKPRGFKKLRENVGKRTREVKSKFSHNRLLQILALAVGVPTACKLIDIFGTWGARQLQETTGAPRIIEARDLLKEWGLEDKTGDAEIAKTAELLDTGDFIAANFFSKEGSASSFIDNLVSIGDGMGFEVRARYEQLGLDPNGGWPRDMDIVFENSQDWYIYMRVYMNQFKEALEKEHPVGVNLETGDGLAELCAGLHPSEPNGGEACYLSESAYKAFVQGSQLPPADAQRLKTYVEETLKKDWYSLENETSMIETAAELARVDVGGVLEIAELLKGEAKYTPNQTVALARASDGLEMIDINKPSVSSFGQESAVLLGLFVMNVANARLSRLGKNWKEKLEQLGKNAWAKIAGKNEANRQ